MPQDSTRNFLDLWSRCILCALASLYEAGVAIRLLFTSCLEGVSSRKLGFRCTGLLKMVGV
jgi:hypothetical protein